MPTDRLVGIGPKRKAGMASLGIESLLDILFTYPRRYIDRRNQATIGSLAEGEQATVLVRVNSVSSRRTRSRKTMTIVETADETGSLRVTFFNQPWRAKQLSAGRNVILFGKCEIFRGSRQMTNPVVDLVGDQTSRIVPVYPNSEKAKIGTAELSAAAQETLRRSHQRGIGDPVPQYLLEKHDLVSRWTALNWIHIPETLEQVAAAKKRLIFDELFRMQVALVRLKNELTRQSVGISHRNDLSEGILAQFLDSLPFELTSAQKRAISEIGDDMAKASPMHRLLQGDVGAGKTLVALAALLIAIQGGYQGALMAPTEVLAAQHFSGLSRLVQGLEVESEGTIFSHRPLKIALLSNRSSAQERRDIATGLKSGQIDLLVGTHALIQDSVVFSSLGMVVIDEQHRFGVEQRSALRAKGKDGTIPDVLVMTATPIPRTAAMTVYGDLDISTLDELPPGRTPIETFWVKDEDGLENMWKQIRSEISDGRQVYIVTPLVEESEKIEAASAEETYLALCANELADSRVGLLHGRVAQDEKEAVMDAFRAGELDALVATTVIEVGVDVPNATVMVILDAHRFGIAQLHQLRGRVGRGSHSSQCYLVSVPESTTEAELFAPQDNSNETSVAEERLGAMVATTDGFELAEIDLELRGEGTIMGENQKGRSDLRLASLRRDRYWIQRCRDDAIELLDADPELSNHSSLAEEIDLLLAQEATEFLFKN